MKVKAYAKLNLSLNVGERTNGLHQIDSVVCSVSVCDQVEVNPRTDKNVTVVGVEGVSAEDNTAYKAGKAFVERFGTNGVDVKITKGVPFCAGMGGSSVDASAVVYAMARLYGVNSNLTDLCRGCGSDVAFMMQGGYARVVGTGDVITPFDALTVYFVVTCFAGSTTTAEVYKVFDKLPKTACTNNNKLVTALEGGKIADVALNCGNMLAPSAYKLQPYLQNFADFNKAHGITAHMTGSGTAHFVVCETLAKAEELKDFYRKNGYDSFVCHSVANGVEEVD